MKLDFSALKLPDLGPLKFTITVRKQLLDCYAAAVEFCSERGADVSWLRVFDLGYKDGYEITKGGWQKRKAENQYAEGAWLMIETDSSSDSDSAKDSLLALGFLPDRILLRRERGRWYQSVYICCWTEYNHEFQVLQIREPEIAHSGRVVRMDEIMLEKPTVTLLCTVCNTRFQSKIGTRADTMYGGRVAYKVEPRDTQHFPKCRGPQKLRHQVDIRQDFTRGMIEANCIRCGEEASLQVSEYAFTLDPNEEVQQRLGEVCQPLIKVPMIGPFVGKDRGEI